MIRERLRRLTAPAAYAECRHCGTTVAPGTESCPECDVDDITQYRIPPESGHT